MSGDNVNNDEFLLRVESYRQTGSQIPHLYDDFLKLNDNDFDIVKIHFLLSASFGAGALHDHQRNDTESLVTSQIQKTNEVVAEYLVGAANFLIRLNLRAAAFLRITSKTPSSVIFLRDLCAVKLLFNNIQEMRQYAFISSIAGHIS